MSIIIKVSPMFHNIVIDDTHIAWVVAIKTGLSFYKTQTYFFIDNINIILPRTLD